MSDNLGYVTYRKQPGSHYPTNLTEGKAYKVQEHFDCNENFPGLGLGNDWRIVIKNDAGDPFTARAWKFEKVGEAS